MTFAGRQCVLRAGLTVISRLKSRSHSLVELCSHPGATLGLTSPLTPLSTSTSVGCLLHPRIDLSTSMVDPTPPDFVSTPFHSIPSFSPFQLLASDSTQFSHSPPSPRHVHGSVRSPSPHAPLEAQSVYLNNPSFLQLQSDSRGSRVVAAFGTVLI